MSRPQNDRPDVEGTPTVEASTRAPCVDRAPTDEAAPRAPITVVGLGANLGDRAETIAAAIAAIADLPDVEVLGRSRLWITRPVGGPPQPDFYNAALAIRTALPPEELLRALLSIEAKFGRVRSERNAPRTVDLDVLWREGPPLCISRENAPEIELPHPRLAERAFALAPLLEVAPDAADPATGKRYADILKELGMEGVRPLDSPGA